MDFKRFMALVEQGPAECKRAEQEIAEAQDKLKRRKAFFRALRSLRTSWADGYAGKYGPHWFFVTNYTIEETGRGGRKHIMYEKCWIAGLVDDPTKAREKCGTLIVEPQACRKHACPICANDAYIVGRYEQTEDGPDGDSWELELSVLCISCEAISSLGNDFKTAYYY